MESQGARIKKIRLEKGISLEEIQKKTKIHLNILKAIEGDGLTDLNPVYLKSFFKIYCKFLGLNPQDYIADYRQVKPAQEAISLKAVSDKPLKSSAFFLQASRIIIIAILILGLFNLGRFISSRVRLHKSLSPKVVKPAAKPQVKSEPVKVKPLPKREAGSGIRLAIRARENCWVSLKIDGRMVFQRVLEKGRSENWQAKERIELSLGNASGVELQVNGQVFSNLDRKGRLRKNIVITREGLNITN